MGVLKFRDETGQVKEILVLRGPKGPAGDGNGDMVAATYDPNGNNRDIFAYADDRATVAENNAKVYADTKIAAIPTPDVSGQIGTHNTDGAAHSDIRTAAANAASAAATAASAAATAQSTANEAKANAATAQSTANEAKTNAATAQSAANAAQAAANSKAPMYTYGTDDLQAGVTALESGKLHFVYE